MSLNKIQTLIQILATPANRLEEAMQQVLVGFMLEDAVGQQLDVLGKLVGQGREGLSDTDFRRYVRARIKANTSNGTIDEVLNVIDLVLNDPAATLVLRNEGAAAFVLQITDTIVTPELETILLFFLRKIAAGGVRAILEPAEDADADILYFDIDNFDQERFIPALE